jgi:hypothetical protein
VQSIIARFQAVAHSSGNARVPQHAGRSGSLPVASKTARNFSRGCTPMQCAGLKTADYSLDLDMRPAEIEQQAQVQTGCRQVIGALGHVRFVERANRFQLMTRNAQPIIIPESRSTPSTSACICVNPRRKSLSCDSSSTSSLPIEKTFRSGQWLTHR